MADRSLQHHPFELSHTRTRQASTSSSDQSSATEDKSASRHPRRRRASSSSGLPQPSVGSDPEPSRRRGSKQSSLGPRDKTSRGPLGNMSGSSDPASEVTYTPTTHRISKAKKGKKVHVCEHVGRHEANHNPEPAFQCRFEDCRKPFQRADLLARHLERQHEVPSGMAHPQSQRSTSEVSSNPASGGMMPSSMGQPQPVAAQAMSHGHGAMAITSIIEHPMRGNELSLSGHAIGEISQTGIGPIPTSFRPEWGYGALGPTLQLPFANVGDQWQPIRSEFASPATLDMGQAGLLKAHNPQTQHYLDCYWIHFAPLFPIIHRQSFMSVIPQPLLAASMMVIGAQYSPRPDAKQYSSSLHAGCTRMMSDVSNKQHMFNTAKAYWVGQQETTTSRSSLSDLQIVFHLEMFNLFRGRSAKLESLQSSLPSSTLYDSLTGDQEFLQVNQASLHQSLPPSNVPGQLQAVFLRWVEHESRRRILVAMFVVDTQHSHLLQRQPCYRETLAEDSLNLPFPTSTDIWDCPDIFTWRDLITSHEAFSLSELGRHLPLLDPFQSSLLTCYQIHGSRISSDPKQHDLIYQSPKSPHQHTLRTHHALAFSTHTPLHALLITASESWLFGTKITDKATWQESKTAIREWVASESARKATWHAVHLLKLTLPSQSPILQQEQPGSGGYLHDLWSLYVATLVCWAYGYGRTNAKAQPTSLADADVDAEGLAAEYLTAMAVGEWQDLDGEGAGIWAGYTRGLMEWVRCKIGEVGMGGLLNGAEDVLFRLVEGESGLVEF
ncbi:MAG: hypothetical protein Q9168_001964 [Polycauliona sp. 1 TL-2023]